MMILLANIHAVWMFLAGVGLLTFFLLKRSYRYFGKRRRVSKEGPIDLQQRPTSKWDGAQKDRYAHLEREKVELYDMARELKGELSSRIIVLEQLIGESGQQIRRMEELLKEMETTREEVVTGELSERG